MNQKESQLKIIINFLDFGLILFFLWIQFLLFQVFFWSIIEGILDGKEIICGYLLILIIFFSSRWLRGPKDQDRKNIKFSLDEWVFELGKRFFSNTVYVLHTISLVILLISLLNTTFKELILSQLWQILPNTLFPVIYFSYSIYMLFVRNWILVRNHKQSS